MGIESRDFKLEPQLYHSAFLKLHDRELELEVEHRPPYTVLDYIYMIKDIWVCTFMYFSFI